MDERKALVIGGASGIGAATAELLELRGWNVTVADLSGEPAVDVSDESSVAALFADLGAIDLVVNSAGTSTLSRITDTTIEEWRRTTDVCLTGAFLVLKYAPTQVRTGGAIITLASLNGTQPGAGLAPYCAAKAGVIMLSKVSAMELADRRIRVNTVSPGLVPTPLTNPALEIPGITDAYLDNTPLGRPGEPHEIAEAIAYLAEAEWITGIDLQIDGGAHTQRYPDLLGLITKAFE